MYQSDLRSRVDNLLAELPRTNAVETRRALLLQIQRLIYRIRWSEYLQVCPVPNPAVLLVVWIICVLLSTEGVYRRDMGRGNSREGGGAFNCVHLSLIIVVAERVLLSRRPAARCSTSSCSSAQASTRAPSASPPLSPSACSRSTVRCQPSTLKPQLRTL